MSPRELSGKFPEHICARSVRCGSSIFADGFGINPFFSHSSICVRANPRPSLKDLSGFRGENSVIPEISEAHSVLILTFGSAFPRLVMFWCEECIEECLMWHWKVHLLALTGELSPFFRSGVFSAVGFS